MRRKSNRIWTWSTGQLDRIARLQNRLRGREVTTLHHLACSGGTLFSKCLATMADALVLSEIHPDRTAQPAFHPLYQAKLGYGELLDPQLISGIDMHFLREIWLADDFATSLDRRLIVRDHAHVDFALRQQSRSRLVDLLSRSFKITPIVTIRNPVEVYLSLKKKGWFDGSPDDLCKAHLALLDAFPGATVFRYEDLVTDPETTVQSLCDAAGITFQPGFRSRLKNVRHLTGDSGRSGDVIAPRADKSVPAEIRAAFEASEAYGRLREWPRYPTDGRDVPSKGGSFSDVSS